MSKKQSVNIMVEGAKATAGPPLGPALGPMGVNAQKVVEQINKKTEPFRGMKIPVEVIVDPATKDFEIVIGTPPTSALILKAAGVEKGAKDRSPVADLSMEQIIEVANSKSQSLLAKDIKGSVKEVMGACQSVGVTVEGMTPKEAIKAVNEGVFDQKLN